MCKWIKKLFKKLIAFFKKLFKKKPSVNLKPKWEDTGDVVCSKNSTKL